MRKIYDDRQFDSPAQSFYFIRHGETDWNLEGRIMGHKDIPLNAKGIEQAHGAAASLQGLEIKRIVTSSLLRAKETAAIVGSYLKVPIELCDGLKEACWGEMEGQLKHKYEGSFEKWILGHTSKDGESCNFFQERVVSALATILTSKETPLIVAHSGVHWTLLQKLGQNNTHPSNAASYFFQPPKHPDQPWVMDAVGEGNTTR